MLSVIGNLKLKWLTFSWWFYQFTFYNHWWPNKSFTCFIKSRKFFCDCGLYTFKTTSIIEFNKDNFFSLLSTTLYPSSNSNNLSKELFIALMNSGNTYSSTISHRSHYFLWNDIVSVQNASVCLWFIFGLSWGFASCTKRLGSWCLVCLSIGWPNCKAVWVNRELSGFVHFVVFCKLSKIQLIKCKTRWILNFMRPIISSY